MDENRLRTPEQVSDDLGGNLKVATIRRHCRERLIAYTGGDRGKYLFTDAQVAAMLAYMSKPPKTVDPRPRESVFKSTPRSKASRRTNTN